MLVAPVSICKQYQGHTDPWMLRLNSEYYPSAADTRPLLPAPVQRMFSPVSEAVQRFGAWDTATSLPSPITN